MDITNWLRQVWAKAASRYKSSSSSSNGLTNVQASAVKPKMTAEDVIEKFDDGFASLIERLDVMNENMGCALEINQKLVDCLGELPTVLECVPQHTRNSKEALDAALEQIRASNDLNAAVAKSIEAIPQETVRQTEAIYDVRETLVDSLEINKSVRNELGRFNDTISRLESTAAGQTESIMQMSRTFASSERYFKYMMDKQAKRFMWIFIAALSICMISIFALAGLIVYLLTK